MQFDPMMLARARLAMRVAAREHLFDPNVRMVSVGLPEKAGQVIEDEIAIRFHVVEKYHTSIQLQSALAFGATRSDLRAPVRVGSFIFQTDVVQGKYHPHAWGWNPWQPAPPPNPRAQRSDPMRGGLSISDEFHYSYGTLGGKVIDRTTGAEMILSNWHVLVADWGARPGQRIYQPGRLDGGTFSDAVATLTRHAMSANLDAAVATLNGSRPLLADQIDLNPVAGAAIAQLGMRVAKSGRRTGVTHGRVTDVDATLRMDYGSISKLIRNVVSIEPIAFHPVSGPGDSGSLWIDEATNLAVGLHFAGSDFPARGLAIDLPTVLDALDVRLALAPAAAPARRIWSGVRLASATPAATSTLASSANGKLVAR
jgi:hypothetical protein